MCGVFGFVAKQGRCIEWKRVERIAAVTETRGRHAFGFAWIDGEGRLRCYKQQGRITDHLGLLAMAKGARMLIGHTRFATEGDPSNNLNNHPHPCDGGWLIHNGMIPRFRGIIDRHALHPVTDCDSEVIALLVERAEGSLIDRCAAAVREIGEQPAVILGLWKHRLIAVRSGNPLCAGQNESGIYFASLSDGLPTPRSIMRDRTAMEVRVDGLRGPASSRHFDLDSMAESVFS